MISKSSHVTLSLSIAVCTISACPNPSKCRYSQLEQSPGALFALKTTIFQRKICPFRRRYDHHSVDHAAAHLTTTKYQALEAHYSTCPRASNS